MKDTPRKNNKIFPSKSNILIITSVSILWILYFTKPEIINNIFWATLWTFGGILFFTIDTYITKKIDKNTTKSNNTSYYKYQIKIGYKFRHIVKISFLTFTFYLLFSGPENDKVFASMWLILYFLFIINYANKFWKNNYKK